MVYERSPGSWAARVTIGKRQVWLGTHPSREAAENAVLRARRGTLPSSVTVDEWAARWAVIYPGRRNESTASHTHTMCRPFTKAYGHKRVCDIGPWEAQGWALQYPSQVRYLRLMFAKAKTAGIIERNPWDDVELPVGSRREGRQRRAPSWEEYEAMVSAARSRFGDRTADMLVFTAFTGLRLMEMADVQTGDMHPGGRRLAVRGKRRAGDDAPRERTVAVFAEARDAFRAHAPDLGFVWRSAAGRRWTRFSVAEMMRAVCRDAGVGPGVTFHSLRHFHASWLLNRGASDLDVALQLGHGTANGTVDPGLVRRVYGHPDVEMGLQRLEQAAG